MHWTVRETGFCHVVTDARKLVYLKGKKMEQYDPTIKKGEDSHYMVWRHAILYFRFVRKVETLLLVFRITSMILISKMEKVFHLIKPDSLFEKNWSSTGQGISQILSCHLEFALKTLAWFLLSIPELEIYTLITRKERFWITES